jgi:nicotinamide mononucleotide transporter
MLHWLLDGTIPVGDGYLSVREVVGNGFGLASALLGMRRLVWAWPVGLVGNVLLFTVFVSGELSGAVAEPLWGQAGRQVLFAAASAYGWWRWQHGRHAVDGGAVAPRWASGSERLGMLGVWALGYVVAYEVLQHIGSYSPPTEAWILTGSVLATYGMARGWVEFWLVWIAVDVVGVTTLVDAGYYPTAGMYLFYGGFCVLGFFAWWRAERRTEPAADAAAGQHTSEGALA